MGHKSQQIDNRITHLPPQNISYFIFTLLAIIIYIILVICEPQEDIVKHFLCENLLINMTLDRNLKLNSST